MAKRRLSKPSIKATRADRAITELQAFGDAGRKSLQDEKPMPKLKDEDYAEIISVASPEIKELVAFFAMCDAVSIEGMDRKDVLLITAALTLKESPYSEHSTQHADYVLEWFDKKTIATVVEKIEKEGTILKHTETNHSAFDDMLGKKPVLH